MWSVLAVLVEPGEYSDTHWPGKHQTLRPRLLVKETNKATGPFQKDF